VVLYTELLCYHPYLVSMLFADLLSLHLVTFLMLFILVYYSDGQNAKMWIRIHKRKIHGPVGRIEAQVLISHQTSKLHFPILEPIIIVNY